MSKREELIQTTIDDTKERLQSYIANAELTSEIELLYRKICKELYVGDYAIGLLENLNTMLDYYYHNEVYTDAQFIRLLKRVIYAIRKGNPVIYGKGRKKNWR